MTEKQRSSKPLPGQVAFPGAGTPYWRQPVRERATGRLRERRARDTVKDTAVIGGKVLGIAAGLTVSGVAGGKLAQRVVRARALRKAPELAVPRPAKAWWTNRFQGLSEGLTTFLESGDPRARNGMGQFSDSAPLTGVTATTTSKAYGAGAGTANVLKKKAKKKAVPPEVVPEG